MRNFDFVSPTYFAFGKGQEKRVGELTKKFKGTRVLLHYGQGSVVKSGLLDSVRESLKAEGISFVELGGVQPNPRASLVYEGVDICKKEGVDFIIGLGGGSVIDSAKAIAVGAVHDVDFWELWEQQISPQKALPVATILTLAATGSEGSDGSVISHEELGKKLAIGSNVMRPVFSILNPEFTMTLPTYQTACGVVDMISHILERYFTNTKNVDLTDRLSEAALKSLIENGRRVMVEPNNYDVRANLMWAGTIAHNDILGVGREQDWSSHQIEHELSAMYDVAHGAGLAVVFPAFMKYTMPTHVMRFAQLAHRVFGIDMDFENPERTARAGIKAFEEFFASLGMPSSFEELGAKEEDIPALAANVHFQNRPDLLGFFQGLTREDVVKVYELMLERNKNNW